MKRASLLAIILTFLTAGCSQFTSSKRDLAPELNLAIPELWASAGSGNQGKMAVGWLAKFEDKEMKALIDEAMQHNHNLRATAANLRSARLGTIIGRANRLPSVSAGLSGSRSSSRSRVPREKPTRPSWLSKYLLQASSNVWISTSRRC